MAILAKKTGGGGMSLGPLPPSGMYHAVCVDVIDLGMVQTTFENKTRSLHMLQLIWQLEQRDQPSQKRYLVGKRYNLSLNEKATLRKDLEAWRKQPFTRDEELGGFDVERVKGAPCLLNVQQVTKATGTYANVVNVNPAMKKLTAEGYTRPTITATAEEPEHDADPFTDDAAAQPDLGAPAAPALVTDDDIPF